jgi:hypothetical protein
MAEGEILERSPKRIERADLDRLAAIYIRA